MGRCLVGPGARSLETFLLIGYLRRLITVIMRAQLAQVCVYEIYDVSSAIVTLCDLNCELLRLHLAARTGWLSYTAIPFDESTATTQSHTLMSTALSQQRLQSFPQRPLTQTASTKLHPWFK